MTEIWKHIEGYEGHYMVSNLGRVKSLDREVNWNFKGVNYKRKIKGRILKQCDDGKGYCRVTLAINSNHINYSVHELVLESFKSKRKEGYQCNHIDGNKTNNNISNLEWVTPSENTLHAHRIGLATVRKGERCHFSKLKRKEVLEIRELHKSGEYSRNEIANIYDIYPNHVSRIINRERWAHI